MSHVGSIITGTSFIVPCLQYRSDTTFKLLDLSPSASKRERETCIEVGPRGKPVQNLWLSLLAIVSLELYRPGPETNYSPLYNVKFKNTWISTFTPPYVCMAQCLIKHTEHFVLPLPVLNLRRQEVVSLSQFRRSLSNALIELSMKRQTVSNCQLRANEEDDSTIVL